MRLYIKQLKLLHPLYEVAAGAAVLFASTPGIKSIIRDTETDEVAITLTSGDVWAVPWSLCRGVLYAAQKPAK